MRAYMAATPLSLRTGNGYEGVVKLLLTRKEVDLEILDGKGGTLLLHAAETGQEGVIELLVEWGGRQPPQSRRYWPNTTLSWATESGTRGSWDYYNTWAGSVNPDMPDRLGVTLLSLATESFDKPTSGRITTGPRDCNSQRRGASSE